MSYIKQCPICTCILFGGITISNPDSVDEMKHISKCENGHHVVQEVDLMNEHELEERLEEMRRRIHENPELELIEGEEPPDDADEYWKQK